MLLNPNAKRILCFGDSLTYGDDMHGGRYDVNTRWTGVLQKLLGDEFDVTEEGLGGRLTNIEDGEKGRNGLVYFKDCLRSHDSLDFIIILLGTNDIKARFNRTPKDIAEALSEYCAYTSSLYEKYSKVSPKIFVLVPPNPKEEFINRGQDFEGAEEKGKMLFSEYKKLSCEVVDLNEFISVSSIDGIHIDADANRIIAEKMASLILNK